MWFFDSLVGMYVTQAVAHSSIALFIVERSIVGWGVDSYRWRFRYRVAVIVLPVVMFPVFQLITPWRGSFYFRLDSAVFDSMRWLGLQGPGTMPAGIALFLAILLLSTLAALFQEIVPILRELLSASKETSEEIAEQQNEKIADSGPAAVLDEVARAAGTPRPLLYVIEDSHPFVHTTGLLQPRILISSSLIEALTPEQLRAALGHEVAHILIRSNLTTILIFLLRIIMFFNPISLMVFRRIVQDDEHVCDDITVSITRNPEALASALGKFYSSGPPLHPRNVAEGKEAIEATSHNLRLKERISRLKDKTVFEDAPFLWSRFGLSLAAIVVICYFVV